MIHTVFSIEDNAYQRWQAQLLAFSHARAGQPGPVTCLVSGGEPDGDFPIARGFRTASWCPHPRTGDRYQPYNKPAALAAWLREAPPEEETILIVDPDCVFLGAVHAEVARGRPIAQPIFYMDIERKPAVCRPPAGKEPEARQDWAAFEEAIRRHCRNPALVRGVGIPTLIHRDDLAALAPLWLAKTEALREDRDLRDRLAWIAEMWAYAIAAAELGLEHDLVDLACFPTEERTDLPIVHYCYDPRSAATGWSWGKRSYVPWTTLAPPPGDVPRAGIALIEVLNACALDAAAWPFGAAIDAGDAPPT